MTAIKSNDGTNAQTVNENKNNGNAKKENSKKKFNFPPKGYDLADSPLVKDTETRLENAIAEISSGSEGNCMQSANGVATLTVSSVQQKKSTTPEIKPLTRVTPKQPAITHGDSNEAADEPTKGIQTVIPMSLYARLSMLKVKQQRTLREMITEAVSFWVNYQEGQY